MRTIVIKNQSGGQKTYAGKVMADAEEYTIQSHEVNKFQTNSVLLDDITAGDADISNGVSYFADANKAIAYLQATEVPPSDADGNAYSPLKIAPLGWTFLGDFFDFTTSDVDSLYHEDEDGTVVTSPWATAKFYDGKDRSTATEVTLAANEGTIEKSCVFYKPPVDYGIRGGAIYFTTPPNVDVRVHVIGVPTYGGGANALPMIRNANLKCLTSGERLTVDGKTIKILSFNGGIGTNELLFAFNHPAGTQFSCQIGVEFYRA